MREEENRCPWEEVEARVESHTAKGAVEQKGRRETRDRVCVLRENARRTKGKEGEREAREAARVHACEKDVRVSVRAWQENTHPGRRS